MNSTRKYDGRALLALAWLGAVAAAAWGCGESAATSSSSGTPGCPAGLTDCGGACVDTHHDPGNCGACGTTCSSAETCLEGACAVSCQGGTVLCGSECVDTALDTKHCGDCVTVCDAGLVCSGGTCGLECTGGTLLCGEACADTQTDETHCGDCATTCAAGETCDGGHCCPGALTYCNGTCADTTQSPVDCGACGVVCGASDICLGGACTPSPLFGADGRAHTVGNLYTIDPMTGQATALLALSSPYAGLAFHNRLLYGVTPGGQVNQINPTTGVETAVTSVGLWGTRDLAVRSDGLLLTCPSNNGQFVGLDLATKTVTTFSGYCSSRTAFAGDASGTMYYVTSNSLYTLDSLAQKVLVTTLSVTDRFHGATFHHGVLYAVTGSWSLPNSFVSVDVVTGAVTTLGPAGKALHAMASASP